MAVPFKHSQHEKRVKRHQDKHGQDERMRSDHRDRTQQNIHDRSVFHDVDPQLVKYDALLENSKHDEIKVSQRQHRLDSVYVFHAYLYLA